MDRELAMNKGNKVPVRGKFKAFFCFVRKRCILLCSSVSLLTAELGLVDAGSVIFFCAVPGRGSLGGHASLPPQQMLLLLLL